MMRLYVAVRNILGLVLLLGICYAAVTAVVALVWALATGRI